MCAEKQCGRGASILVQERLSKPTFLLHLSLLMLEIDFLFIPLVHTGWEGHSGSLPSCVPAERQQQVRGKASQQKPWCSSVTGQCVCVCASVCETYQNSLLQGLPKKCFVLRADLLQVHLAAGHNDPGHQPLFGAFRLEESGKSQQLKFEMLETKAQWLMQRRCKKTLANFWFCSCSKNGTFTSADSFESHWLDVCRWAGLVSTFMASFNLLAKYSCLFSKHWTGRQKNNVQQ